MKNYSRKEALSKQTANISILKESGYEDVEEYVLISFYCKVFNEFSGTEEYEELHPNITFETASDLSDFVYGY